MSRRRYGPWRQIVRPRVKDHQLILANPSGVGDVQLPLALGLVLGNQISKFEFRTSGDYQQLRVQLTDSGEKVLVSPPFSGIAQIATADNSERIELEFWAVDNLADRDQCLRLLRSVHYLEEPRRGIFLACRFSNSDQQRNSLQRAPERTRRRKWAVPGAIIACAVVDTLMHGQPKGRAAIAHKLGYPRALQRWSRSEVVANLRVAWLSRVAVAPPFQRLGIGVQLALKARQMTRRMRIPRADFLEVIRSFPAKHNKQKAYVGDFLTGAGFIRIEEPMRSGPCLFPTRDSLRRIPQPAVKFYYYADVRNDD